MNRIKNNGIRFEGVLPLFLLIILAVFILYPMMMILYTSFNHNGVFSFISYKEVCLSKTTHSALVNTIQLACGTLAGTWIMGGLLAFIRQRTDYKYKKQLDIFVFLSFTIPAYILSITWIEVLSRGGYINRILNYFQIGITYRFNAYTIGAAVFVLTLHLYPFVYYGVGNALKVLGESLEQSAKVCGVHKIQILLRVTLPLVIPSFLSTGLLVVSRSMANYGVLAQVALPTGQEVLTTRIFSAMSDLDLPAVAVLSVLLIALSLTLFLLSDRVLKNKNYGGKDSGKRSVSSGIELGRLQIPLRIVIAIFFGISIILPMLTISVSSFFKRWGLSFELKNLTFGNYVKLFSEENLLTEPLLNTLFFGIIAAGVASLIAALTVYFYKYRKGSVSKAIMHIAQLPIAVPNMILGVAVMFAWIREPIKLYGTAAILIITYTILFIPVCIKQISGTANNLNKSLDQLARTMQIPLLQRFGKLFLPQIKESVMSGFLLCFLIALKEIPISLLLYTATTKTLGVMLFTVQSNSYGLEMTSAIAVVVIAISVTGHLLLLKLGSRGYKA